ncbi:MAG: hypothetical protein AB1746_11700 [Candidatus Zixiibacteriota bacterium]
MHLVKLLAFTVLIMLVISSISMSSTPQLINYQGRLLDEAGLPVPDGNYNISFKIYDALTGGIQKWAETQSGVPVTDGLFSIVMGSSEPLSDTVFDGEDRYLEISFDGQALSPRIQFTSVGYAHRISTVDGASAGKLSGTLVLSPTDYLGEGNAITIVNENDAPVLAVTIDPLGSSTLSFYDPADSKAATSTKIMDLAVNQDGMGSLSFYEPADSKSGLAFETKKVEMRKDGLFMFGASEFDTSLIVAPNGDIIGLGQITMGQNSSSGTETSVLGFNNSASGDSSTIGGGSFNQTFGVISVIAGGHANTAGGIGSTISGGSANNAGGNYSTISGGFNNTAPGDFSIVPGGSDNDATGFYSYAAGHRAKAFHDGSFVWADHTDDDFGSTGADQFIIRAGGGVGIGTNNPTGILDVAGYSGDGSVNLPDSAVSSPEILDEPGISGEITPADIVLTQGATSMADMATTTITIPADGYIMVSAGATMEATGTSKANQVFIQIDETSGGSTINPYYVITGSGDHDTPSSKHYFSISTERIYLKSAGTYEFRLEAIASPDNGNGAETRIQRPRITAVYFPTAYGSVSASN